MTDLTDNQIMEIVSRNMRGSLEPGSDRRHMFRFNDEIKSRASIMTPEDAAIFKHRASEAMDKWLAAMQEVIDEIPDEPAPPPARYVPRQPARSSYVGRTVIRAVVWNVVNSIFRVFR